MSPARSKAQMRFMGAVIAGKAKAPGLSKTEAKEFLRGHSQKGLPEHVKKKGKG